MLVTINLLSEVVISGAGNEKASNKITLGWRKLKQQNTKQSKI